MKLAISVLVSLSLAEGPAAPTAGAPSAVDPAAQPEAQPLPAALLALELPIAANELRKAGASEADVKSALEAAKGAGLKPEEAAELAQSATVVVKQHGPVDNFGATVQAHLASGLRGRELAAAIRADHAASGKGGGHGADGDHGHSHGEGKGHGGGKLEGKAGKSEGLVKPEGKEGKEAKATTGGKPEGKAGKPEGAGKSGGGKPEGKAGRADKEQK